MSKKVKSAKPTQKPAKPVAKGKVPTERQYQNVINCVRFHEQAILSINLFIEELAVIQQACNNHGLRGGVCWVERMLAHVRKEQEWHIVGRIEAEKKKFRYRQLAPFQDDADEPVPF